MQLTIPSYDHDIFASEAILAPYEHYRAIRELGPVVALPGLDILAVGRYDDVRDVLSRPEIFRSGRGVALTEPVNQFTSGTTLTSDDELHEHLRGLLAHRLTPRALRSERDRVGAAADQVVDAALAKESIDGVTDIARAMPMEVIPDFVGLPEDCRPHVLRWAQAAMESFGPVTERTPDAMENVVALGGYTASVVAEHRTPHGSLADDLVSAAERGEIPLDRCPVIMVDYFAPSMETTISALSSALALFAEHTDQWDALRANPSLVGGALNEVIRLESPIRGFTRYVGADTELSGVRIAEGSRVLALFASANRDERRWEDSDRFDISRDNTEHLAFGHGVHGCAGQGMARLEVVAVLQRLIDRVERIEFTGDPVPAVNSITRGYESLPLRLVPAN
ncbi:cytochrome P450 [Gordonia sp. NPDC003424]